MEDLSGAVGRWDFRFTGGGGSVPQIHLHSAGTIPAFTELFSSDECWSSVCVCVCVCVKLSCQRPASVPPVFDAEHHGSWVLCLDRRFSLAQRIVSKHCRVYSLRSVPHFCLLFVTHHKHLNLCVMLKIRARAYAPVKLTCIWFNIIC